MSKTFDEWVGDARYFCEQGEDGEMHDCIIAALEALAMERALFTPRAPWMQPPFEGPVEGFNGPRSYSHWGMIA